MSKISVNDYCQGLLILVSNVSDEYVRTVLIKSLKALRRDHGELELETVGQIADRLNEGELE